MARQKKRGAFPTETKRDRFDAAASNAMSHTYLNTERSGLFGFLCDRGVRETIESIVVAIILALVFRAYEAEAFVIPTGSMAPSLQGQHRDINCDQCNYLYQTGASEESSSTERTNSVQETFCPICQFKTKMKEATNPNHRSNSGDRILVNKFVYDFADPKRFDVIVFKNPNNGKQNYIKRLVGLPGEEIFIENGDLFRYEKVEGQSDIPTIIRKPDHKLDIMMQLVDDTNHIPQKMHDVGWPLRWQQWSEAEPESNWTSILEEGTPTYEIDAADATKWLRYRHLAPLSRKSYANAEEIYEWDDIIDGNLPRRVKGKNPMGRLISDYYCYNHRVMRKAAYNLHSKMVDKYSPSQALEWVGDIGTEIWCEVKSEDGELILEVVEGGAKFNCTIDVKTGKATLSSDSNLVDFVDKNGNSVETPSAQTELAGSGKYRILFANVDDQLRLSINQKFVDFDAATFLRNERVMPTSFPNDKSNLGDAEPVSIGAKNVSLEITRLKILRDIYYTSPENVQQPKLIDNETAAKHTEFEKIGRWFDKPDLWSSPSAIEFFNSRFRDKPYVYKLEENQFLPMGDNSPASLDGRVWDGPKFVDREMLIGRASFIYWPHSLNSPKYFPNFKKMKFIR